MLGPLLFNPSWIQIVSSESCSQTTPACQRTSFIHIKSHGQDYNLYILIFGQQIRRQGSELLTFFYHIYVILKNVYIVTCIPTARKRLDKHVNTFPQHTCQLLCNGPLNIFLLMHVIIGSSLLGNDVVKKLCRQCRLFFL